jgi:uncharacterized protein (TIGR02147 family)
MKPPDIFRYTDYRQFLKDYAESLKSSNKSGITLLSEMAGHASRINMYEIINGRRGGLGIAPMVKLVKAMKMNAKEALYFDQLVHYGNSKDPVVRKYYRDLISKYSNKS